MASKHWVTAMVAGRIKRKDAGSGNKFAEYVPYWA